MKTINARMEKGKTMTSPATLASTMTKGGMTLSAMDAQKHTVIGKGETMSKCCDNCFHYHWYYDHCDKWNCKVDDRSSCNEFTERRDDDTD